jgi:apolipoprotein D and lipocalin family protein
MKNFTKTLIYIATMLGLSACSSGNLPNLKTVEKVDLDRYQGEWNEIARIDHWFQEGCINSTANYTIREDGDIKVLNRCDIEGEKGEKDEAIGRAWVVDEDSNAKLKVQFPLKGIKLTFLAGDYWIIALEENYQYAMIGDPKREYLWILARDKKLPQSTLDRLITKAKDDGFPTEKLIFK